MAEYFTAFGWSVISAVLLQRLRYGKLYYVLANAIPLILYCGLRDKLEGSDTVAYYAIYTGVIHGADNGAIEPSIEYISYAIDYFDGSAETLIFVYAFMSIVGMMIFFYHISKNIYITIPCYIAVQYYFLFNGIRQGMAIALLCNAMLYLWNGKKTLFYILAFVAIFFHYSAIIFLPLVLINPLSTKKFFISVIVIALVLGIMFNNDNLFLSYFVPEKYIWYLMDAHYADTGISSMKFIRGLLFLFVALWGLYLNKHIQTDCDKNINLWLAFFSFLTFCDIIATDRMRILLRFEPYFNVFICVYIPILLRYVKQPWRTWIYPGMYILFVLYIIRCVEITGTTMIPSIKQ